MGQVSGRRINCAMGRPGGGWLHGRTSVRQGWRGGGSFLRNPAGTGGGVQRRTKLSIFRFEQTATPCPPLTRKLNTDINFLVAATCKFSSPIPTPAATSTVWNGTLQILHINPLSQMPNKQLPFKRYLELSKENQKISNVQISLTVATVPFLKFQLQLIERLKHDHCRRRDIH